MLHSLLRYPVYNKEFKAKDALRRTKSEPALIPNVLLLRPQLLPTRSNQASVVNNSNAADLNTHGIAQLFPVAAATNSRTAISAAHNSGTCRPCSFFTSKLDGCRLGDSCSMCHFCTAQQVKEKHRAKRIAAKTRARLYAMNGLIFRGPRT